MPNSNPCKRPGCQNQAKAKFCSRSCAAIVNNTNSPKRKKRGVCPGCGAPAAHNRKYCSQACHYAVRWQPKLDAWLQGEDGSDGSGVLSAIVRNYLLDESQNRCSRCSWGEANPVTGKVILTVDHVDGNWKNNKRDNLVVLCYNCHSLTPTFGALNKRNPRRVKERRRG